MCGLLIPQCVSPLHDYLSDRPKPSGVQKRGDGFIYPITNLAAYSVLNDQFYEPAEWRFVCETAPALWVRQNGRFFRPKQPAPAEAGAVLT
jgi:hypothetical protein